MNRENIWKIGATVGVLLAVFLLALSISAFRDAFGLGSNPNMTNIITVEGTGEVVAVPDIATFSFSVNEIAGTVGEAQEQATEKTNSAIQAVRANGVEERDIKTLSYNISPHYEYQQGVCESISFCRPGKSILTGYEVSQTIQVKVRDISKAGQIFSTIGALEVQNVNGLSFEVDDTDALKAEARKDAIEEAKQKADILADQLGVRLVKIVNYSEYSGNGRPIIYGMGGDEMSAVKTAAPSVPVGEQETTVSVSISYEIR